VNTSAPPSVTQFRHRWPLADMQEYAQRRHDPAEIGPVAFSSDTLGITPDNWQADVLCSTRDRLLLNCSRQAGKSTTSATLALYTALYRPRSLTLLISPSLRQSAELFRKVTNLLEQLPSPPVLVEDNKLSLTTDRGSRIVSLPSSGATIRGFSAVDLLIEDEAAYVPDELYYAVRPMLAVSGGRLVLMSTPNGKAGHFWQAWDSGDDWQRVMVPATDVPRIPVAFLDEERRALGERRYRQEYLCEFVDEIEGALWRRAWIDAARVTSHPDLSRIVVAVDPAATSSEDADETGIIVAGKGIDGDGYVIADRSCRMSPDGWGRRAVQAYIDFHADRIVYEKNQGGEMVEHVLRVAWQAMGMSGKPPTTAVHASRGKQTRAEPIAALYEQGKAHHVGVHPELEDQLTSWTPQGGNSPDRLDANVWALSELMLKPERKWGAV
jgi:phage terminase large subunit-like protein